VTIGDGKSYVCICAACNNVVNPERDGFRVELKPCPECGATLNSNDVLDLFNMPGNRDGTEPCGVKCPRCKTGDLAFRTGRWFSMNLDNVAPEPEELVHGYYEDGALIVPGMFLPSWAREYVLGAPDDIGEKVMELRTSNVQRNGENIESIEFEFVRVVDP
jgi:hypothetical protein